LRAFKQILNKDRARTDELNREGSANFRLVMKKIQEILISTRTMAVLLLVYAAAMITVRQQPKLWYMKPNGLSWSCCCLF